MEQEYRVSKMKKRPSLIFATLLILFFVYFLIKKDVIKLPILFILASFCVVAVLIVVNNFKRKVIISNKSILYISSSSTKELSLTNIKGYQMEGKRIKIEPISETADTLSIDDCFDFEGIDELKAWIVENFKNLDASDFEIEEQAFLKNPEFGFAESDRLEKLKTSKQIAMAYNVGGVALALGTVFFDTKQIGCYLLLLYPLTGILILNIFGLIKFMSNSNKSIYAQIFIGYIASSLILLFTSSYYNMFQLERYWGLSLIVSGIVFGLLYVVGNKKSDRLIKGKIVIMLMSALLYGFGSIRASNCVLDTSVKQLFNARVLNHSVSSGRHTSYYLTLSEWGPQTKVEEVKISRKLYNNTVIGDTVRITIKTGLLHIPWFTVSKK